MPQLSRGQKNLTMNKIKKHPVHLLLIFLVPFISCGKEEVLQKIEPEIIWTNPSDISCGTTLSEYQLNASANIPGTFEYTPAIGTNLPEGANQILKVTFTPYDKKTYNTANQSVYINVISPTAEDIDGNIYNLVTIGSQIWMVENLRTTKYRNGDPISNIENETDWRNANTGAYCWYNNDKISFADNYGALYNGHAVLDNRNIAPTGWRVPTVTDFNTLIAYLGGRDAGGKMKHPATHYWNFPNTGASNESGFSAKPGGICCYPNEYFSNKNYKCYFWTSDTTPSNLWFSNLSHDTPSTGWGQAAMYMGMSVRCIRNN